MLPADRERYQTVFAREKGSVAAPTAGLHFTPEVLARCRAAGAEQAFVTLHVGLGTFQPLHEELVEEAKLHTRALPHHAGERRGDRWPRGAWWRWAPPASARWKPPPGRDDSKARPTIFIYPGMPFLKTGAMLTNFHLPRTSLLLLVCAFAGKELTLARLPPRGGGGVPLLFLRRLHADCVNPAEVNPQLPGRSEEISAGSALGLLLCPIPLSKPKPNLLRSSPRVPPRLRDSASNSSPQAVTDS